MLKCVCCNKSNEEHKMITCRICKGDYFHSCVDLTTSEIRTIKSKKNLSWTCQKCSVVGDDINDLKALIISLQKEIENLKSVKSSAVNECTSCNTSLDFEEIIQEISDRNARKNNIILYGIVENPTADRDGKILHDQQKVSKVLSCVIPEVTFGNDLKPIRLGKFDPTKKNPRPIKIVLPSETMAHNIIQKAYRLKNLQDPKNVRISLDKTVRQQQTYRRAKDELSTRIAGGEDNLRIKYIRGSPKIISSN